MPGKRAVRQGHQSHVGIQVKQPRSRLRCLFFFLRPCARRLLGPAWWWWGGFLQQSHHCLGRNRLGEFLRRFFLQPSGIVSARPAPLFVSALTVPQPAWRADAQQLTFPLLLVVCVCPYLSAWRAPSRASCRRSASNGPSSPSSSSACRYGHTASAFAARLVGLDSPCAALYLPDMPPPSCGTLSSVAFSRCICRCQRQVGIPLLPPARVDKQTSDALHAPSGGYCGCAGGRDGCDRGVLLPADRLPHLPRAPDAGHGQFITPS